jgi:hypothetical protein
MDIFIFRSWQLPQKYPQIVALAPPYLLNPDYICIIKTKQ